MGGVFFAVGMLILYASLTGQAKDAETGEPAHPANGIVFAIAFGLPGLAIMGGRRGARVDRTGNTLDIWWGVFIPFSHTTHPLTGFDKVQVFRRVSGSGKSRSVSFVVSLVCSGAKAVEVGSHSACQMSRRQGEGARAIRDAIHRFAVMTARHRGGCCL